MQTCGLGPRSAATIMFAPCGNQSRESIGVAALGGTLA
jgi:hypothetical protein